MSTNTEFLSPRGLLIEDTFCCDGPSFRELYDALLSTQNLPASDDQICSKSGLTVTEYRTLYTMVWPIVEKFQEIQHSSVSLRVKFTPTRCAYRNAKSGTGSIQTGYQKEPIFVI
ncbi:hypothetical protein BDV29DRAFT_154485 [Aspergillus leporis]|uniref:Uncharacterized protein n=1 Tax=Aspergillus leporis TaxID=41062 RepID=A0A5N5XBA7_9EURO|nr:hypothetical protein BDV29DRAFT_154485 [Aspergillus leporis]